MRFTGASINHPSMMSARSRAKATLLLAESAEARMQRAARDAVGLEAGGILLGVFTAGDPYITCALEIPSAVPSPHRYQVPAGVTQSLVACVQRVDDRLGYLGEWHVHPANVPPSSVDMQTMTRLAQVLAREGVTPVLVILCRTSDAAYTIDAARWAKSGQRPLTVVRAGDLMTVAGRPGEPTGLTP